MTVKLAKARLQKHAHLYRSSFNGRVTALFNLTILTLTTSVGWFFILYGQLAGVYFPNCRIRPTKIMLVASLQHGQGYFSLLSPVFRTFETSRHWIIQLTRFQSSLRASYFSARTQRRRLSDSRNTPLVTVALLIYKLRPHFHFGVSQLYRVRRPANLF